MKNSNIEWTDNTFNPWIGCTKVSPGCANCYAETRMDKRLKRVKWGKGQPRSRTSEAYWRGPVQWNKDADMESGGDGYYDSPLSRPPRRPRVFCASLADWLDDEVPIEWLADLLDLIRRTPNLDWLLLTKRPQFWASRIELVLQYIEGLPDWNKDSSPHPLESLRNWLADWFVLRKAHRNVWIGTTVEDQTRADERIPALLSIPARVRFLSCEPLLGPVHLLRVDAAGFGGNAGHKVDSIRKGFWSERWGFVNHSDMHDKFGPIHWVIVGGESGPGARPMHPDWARSLRDQCAAAGVPFFFKQWGEWLPQGIASEATPVTVCGEGKGGCWEEDEFLLDEYQAGYEHMKKVGKKAAGRLLDGVEHNAFPKEGAAR